MHELNANSDLNSGSGRCSAATAASTSPSSTSSTPERCGSLNSTSPSPASSPGTGPTPRTWATSRPSTGAWSSPWTFSSVGFHARTCPRSASAPASRQGRARDCGHTWPKRSTRFNLNGSSSRTSAGCCPHPPRGTPQKETTMNNATPAMQPQTTQPFTAWNPTRGIWETTQLDLLRALGAVLGDLADLRLDARWIGLPASLVGAPHQRFRIFAVARRTVPHPTGDRLLTRRGNPRPGSSPARDDRTVPPVSTSHFTDRLARRAGEPNRRRCGR